MPDLLRRAAGRWVHSGDLYRLMAADDNQGSYLVRWRNRGWLPRPGDLVWGGAHPGGWWPAWCARMVLLIDMERERANRSQAPTMEGALDVLGCVAWALGAHPDAEWVLVWGTADEWQARTFAINEAEQASATWATTARQHRVAVLVAVPAMPNLLEHLG